MFVLSALTLMRPVIQDIKEHHGVRTMLTNFGAPRFSGNNLFAGGLLIVFVAMLTMSLSWPFEAKIIPTIVGITAVIACGLSLLNDVFGQHHSVMPAAAGIVEDKTKMASQKIHMDVESKTGHLPPLTILLRGLQFFGWMVAFLGSMATIGLIPTVPLFVIAYMRLEGPEKWRHAAIMAVVMVTLIYVVFDQLLTIPWPPTLLGTYFPAFKVIPSV
jgi:hypothetical protein